MKLHLGRRLAAVLFVLLTAVFWWILSQAAASVVTAYQHRFGADGPVPPSHMRDIVILILTLLAALWAAARAVFPPEDFSVPSAPATPPGK